MPSVATTKAIRLYSRRNELLAEISRRERELELVESELSELSEYEYIDMGAVFAALEYE